MRNDVSAGTAAWPNKSGPRGIAGDRPLEGGSEDIRAVLRRVQPIKRDWGRFYLDPRGRVSRRDYWLYGFLVLALVNLIVGAIPIVGANVSPLLAWSSVALAVKRCHDLDRTGWWAVTPLIVGMAGAFLSYSVKHPGALSPGATAAIAAALIAGIGASLWLLCGILVRRGDPRPNRFGQPPSVTSN